MDGWKFKIIIFSVVGFVVNEFFMRFWLNFTHDCQGFQYTNISLLIIKEMTPLTMA